jgi:transcriptional regulator with PAS, ATPase and Fis domain
MKVFTEDDYKGEFNLKVMEKIYIKIALKKHKNHRRKAAKDLEITERTLYRKLQEHQL